MERDTIEDFTPDDLPYVNLAMRAFPHVAHGFRALVTVTSKLSFPVSGPDEIARAAGGHTLRYGDSDIPLDELPDLMPAYYFPIESAEDFLAKVADVCERVREPQGRNLAATLMEAKAPDPGHSPPNIDVAEIIRVAGLDERAATPSAGGLHRRAD
jgi:hypothetical protein